jgi:hypothetical protein
VASLDTTVRAPAAAAADKALLFFAFAIAVIADAVSSVGYAVKAALRALGGRPGSTSPLMAIAGTALVAELLYCRRVHAGRPRGIQAIERHAENDQE